MKLQKIDLSKRLPDIHKHEELSEEFDSYGRFGILQNGVYWFGGIKSSHPAVQEGFYWALKNGTLFISPRGSTYQWTTHLTQDILQWLLKKLELRSSSNFLGHHSN